MPTDTSYSAYDLEVLSLLRHATSEERRELATLMAHNFPAPVDENEQDPEKLLAGLHKKGDGDYGRILRDIALRRFNGFIVIALEKHPLILPDIKITLKRVVAGFIAVRPKLTGQNTILAIHFCFHENPPFFSSLYGQYSSKVTSAMA